MWPAKNKGEDARLYDAVQAVSDFAIELGINIPTGKDSLSMTQKYPDGDCRVCTGHGDHFGRWRGFGHNKNSLPSSCASGRHLAFLHRFV